MLFEANKPNCVSINRISGKRAKRKSNANCDDRPIDSFLLSPSMTLCASCKGVSPLSLQRDFLGFVNEGAMVGI